MILNIKMKTTIRQHNVNKNHKASKKYWGHYVSRYFFDVIMQAMILISIGAGKMFEFQKIILQIFSVRCMIHSKLFIQMHNFLQKIYLKQSKKLGEFEIYRRDRKKYIFHFIEFTERIIFIWTQQMQMCFLTILECITLSERTNAYLNAYYLFQRIQIEF